MAIRQIRRVGFTLIEMVITVVILGIITAVGLPSFLAFLSNTQLRSASESTVQGLHLARAEAVRLNTRVRFVAGSNSAWTVSTDAGAVVQSKGAREGSPNVTLAFFPTTSKRVTFNSFGRVTNNADAVDGLQPFTKIDFSATGGTVSRRIIITAGGQIQICDPAVGTAGDPRKC